MTAHLVHVANMPGVYGSK